MTDGQTPAVPSPHRVRTWALTAAVLLVAAAAWWLLGFHVRHVGERFYLLVPPVSLALIAVHSAQPGREARVQARSMLLALGLLIVVAALFSVGMGLSLFPHNPLLAVSLPEVAAGAYFILAFMVLAIALRGLFRRCLLWLTERCLPRRLVFLRRHAVETLTVLLLVPLLIGVLHIHRFKVPNLPDSTQFEGWPRESVSFPTADGLTIRGWFFPAKTPSTRTLLICHGLGANRTAFTALLPVGAELEANVLMFDFRGHGDSDGHTVTFGYWEKLDVLAAVDYLRTQRPEQARHIVGLGMSMGTAGLIRAAAEVEPPLDAVIIDSGYASAEELTDNVLNFVPAFTRPPIIFAGLPAASLSACCWLPDVRPLDDVPRLRAPVLFIHARDDELIPASHAQRLYDAACEPKSLWITDTGGHGSSFQSRAEYLRRTAAILRSP